MALVLHLGDAKCGSSALQDSLYVKRGDLYENGILYETGPKYRNHFLIGNLLGQSTRSADPDQETYAHDMLKEIARRAHGTDHTIISSERLLLTDPNRFLDLLDRYRINISEIHAIAYVREPRSMYASLVQQELKASYRFRSPLEYRRPLDRFVALWQEAIGKNRLNVRVFDRATLLGGDITSDFSSYLKSTLGKFIVDLPARDSNSSLSAEQLIVLQILRRKLPESFEGKFHSDSNAVISSFTRMNKNGIIGNPIRLNSQVSKIISAGNRDILKRMNTYVPGVLDSSSEPLISERGSRSEDEWNISDDISSMLNKVDITLVTLFSNIMLHKNSASSQQALISLYSDKQLQRQSILEGLSMLKSTDLTIWGDSTAQIV